MGPKRCQTHHLGLFSSLPPTIVILIAMSIVQSWWSFLWLWSLCGGGRLVVLWLFVVMGHSLCGCRGW